MELTKAKHQDHTEDVKYQAISPVSMMVVVHLTPDEDYLPQQWRLAQYFRSATVASFALLLFLCTLCFVDPTAARRNALHFGAIAVPSLAASVIPAVLTWQTTKAAPVLPRKRVDRLWLNRLCAAVYASTILLMFAPVCLLLLRNAAYAVVVVPLLLPVAVVLYLLLRKGGRLGFAWGTAQYGPHQHDLQCLFTLAAGVTVPAYVGLLGHVVSQFRSSRAHVQEEDGVVGSLECMLLLAAIAGLMQMLLTSSPPAVNFDETREALVDRLLGTLANVQLALLGAAGLSAAAEIVRGLAVLALAVDVIVACAVFAREHDNEPIHRARAEEHDGGRGSRAPPDVAPLLLNSLAFAVLMLSYGVFVNGSRAGFSWQRKAGVVAVASLLVGNLTRMALHNCKTGRSDTMVFAASLLRKANNLVLGVVILFGMVTLLLEPSGKFTAVQKLLSSFIG